MVKAEQVPYDAVRAAYAAWAGGGGNNVLSAMEQAIAAAINAWPGMHEVDHRVTAQDEVVSFSVVLPIILPLPQEKETSA